MVNYQKIARNVFRTAKRAIRQTPRKTLSGTKSLIQRAKSKVQYAIHRTIENTKPDTVLPSMPLVSKLDLSDPSLPHLLLSNIPSEAAFVRGSTAFIDRWESTLSPIRRLPPEILLGIFSWLSLSTISYPHLPEDRTPANLPWAVSHVCQSWRAIALSTPSLWNCLPMMELKTSTSIIMHQITLLTELIHRSNQTLLDLYIHCPDQDQTDHPVIQFLVRFSRRWKNLTIESTSKTIEGFKDIKGQVPCLTMLNIVISQSWHHDNLNMFEDAPHLRDVHIAGNYCGELRLPVQALVRRTDLSGSMTYRIRQPVPYVHANLKWLTLHECALLIENNIQSFVQEFPRLTNLDFSSSIDVEFGFLQRCSFPALVDLRIKAYHGNLLQVLTSVFERSGCSSLKNMYLRMSVPNEPGHLSALLGLTPKLVRLDISFPCHADILALASSPGGQPLVPKLKHCTFHLENFIDQDRGLAVGRLASARCGPREHNAIDHTIHKRCTMELRIDCDFSAMRIDRGATYGPFMPILRQASFESWYRDPSTTPLYNLAVKLYTECPLLSRGLGEGRCPTSNSKKIRRILSDIENFDIKDGKEFLTSNLHIAIIRIAVFYKVIYWQEDKYHFYDQAVRILEKWRPLLIKDLKECHWAWETLEGCLVYVGEKRNIRAYPEVFADAIMGWPLPNETWRE